MPIRRSIFVMLAMLFIAAATVTAPAHAQTEGGGFCDLFGGLLGEDGQTQCEEQGGDQIPLEEVTTPTCEAADQLLTAIEDGGGGALAEPIRQVFEDTGACTFASQPEEPAPTTAPTAAPLPTLPETGAPLAAGLPVAATGLAGVVLAGAVGVLRRLGRRH